MSAADLIDAHPLIALELAATRFEGQPGDAVAQVMMAASMARLGAYSNAARCATRGWAMLRSEVDAAPSSVLRHHAGAGVQAAADLALWCLTRCDEPAEFADLLSGLGGLPTAPLPGALARWHVRLHQDRFSWCLSTTDGISSHGSLRDTSLEGAVQEVRARVPLGYSPRSAPASADREPLAELVARAYPDRPTGRIGADLTKQGLGTLLEPLIVADTQERPLLEIVDNTTLQVHPFALIDVGGRSLVERAALTYPRPIAGRRPPAWAPSGAPQVVVTTTDPRVSVPLRSDHDIIDRAGLFKALESTTAEPLVIVSHSGHPGHVVQLNDPADAEGHAIIGRQGVRDWIVTAEELAGLDIHRGIVLAGCVGAGALGATGEPVGVAARLLHAGAPWVIASPWMVPVVPSLGVFLERLAQSLISAAPPEALRATQCEMLGEGPLSDPLAWAPWRVLHPG